MCDEVVKAPCVGLEVCLKCAAPTRGIKIDFDGQVFEARWCRACREVYTTPEVERAMKGK